MSRRGEPNSITSSSGGEAFSQFCSIHARIPPIGREPADDDPSFTRDIRETEAHLHCFVLSRSCEPREANGIELIVIRLVRPSEQALTWVSDLVIAVVLAAAIYLRLDLQATRMRLSRVEQEQIVADTELSLAAEIQSGRLPKAPSAGSGFSWAARLRQARKIGGDFYDFVPVNPEKVVCDSGGRFR